MASQNKNTQPSQTISLFQVVYYCLLPLASIATLILLIGQSISGLTSNTANAQCTSGTYTPASNHVKDMVFILISVLIILLLIGLFKYKSWIYKTVILLVIIAIGAYVFFSTVGAGLGGIGCLSF